MSDNIFIAVGYTWDGKVPAGDDEVIEPDLYMERMQELGFVIHGGDEYHVMLRIDHKELLKLIGYEEE